MKHSLKCTCNREIKLGKVDGSGKQHGHCISCELEWHVTLEGKKYSHKYDRNIPEYVRAYKQLHREGKL